MAFVSAQRARAAYCGRLEYDVEQGLKVLMELVTAPAMACALDALVKDTIGVSNRSIVVGSLGSAGTWVGLSPVVWRAISLQITAPHEGPDLSRQH